MSLFDLLVLMLATFGAVSLGIRMVWSAIDIIARWLHVDEPAHTGGDRHPDDVTDEVNAWLWGER